LFGLPEQNLASKRTLPEMQGQRRRYADMIDEIREKVTQASRTFYVTIYGSPGTYAIHCGKWDAPPVKGGLGQTDANDACARMNADAAIVALCEALEQSTPPDMCIAASNEQQKWSRDGVRFIQGGMRWLREQIEARR
jgi:hypothetical protein